MKSRIKPPSVEQAPYGRPETVPAPILRPCVHFRSQARGALTRLTPLPRPFWQALYRLGLCYLWDDGWLYTVAALTFLRASGFRVWLDGLEV